MEKIPLYDLPDRSLPDFGFKLYHLKNSAFNNGQLSSIPLNTNIPHRHNFYEICVFIEGGGIHEIDFCTYPVESCSLHFISPGQVHLLGGKTKKSGYVIAFTPEFFSDDALTPGWLIELPFFNPLHAAQIIQLKPKNFSYFLQILDHIANDYDEMGNQAQHIIRSYLKILLLKSNHLYKEVEASIEHAEDPSHKLVHLFKSLIEQHFNEKHQVQQFSELLNVSSAHLNKCCKQTLGKTASELIMQRILLEAKRLLIFSDQSSKEIAYQLQFEDPAYFSRIFKKKTGYAPSEFRHAMLEKYKSY